MVVCTDYGAKDFKFDPLPTHQFKRKGKNLVVLVHFSLSLQENSVVLAHFSLTLPENLVVLAQFSLSLPVTLLYTLVMTLRSATD